MAANTTPDLKRTIDRGLLPENLPSVINSKALWPHFEEFSASYIVTTKRSGRVSPYNASKRGFQRRLFGLPHPIFIHDQAAFLQKHWDDILPGLEAASGSLSRPGFPIHGPRSTKITPHSALARARLEAFSRFKFCLVTDVSRCFPSIYTHSIPWAIHGKAASKEDTKANSATIFGNRLDFAVRQAQDRQTIGIPVGPDTSRVTSEIILSAVDREFVRRSGAKGITYAQKPERSENGRSFYRGTRAGRRGLVATFSVCADDRDMVGGGNAYAPQPNGYDERACPFDPQISRTITRRRRSIVSGCHKALRKQRKRRPCRS